MLVLLVHVRRLGANPGALSVSVERERTAALFVSESYRKMQGLGVFSVVQEGGKDQNSASGKIPFTFVSHKNDGVLRDAHTQGHLPELLQKAVPQLWLPACKQKAEERLRTLGALAS